MEIMPNGVSCTTATQHACTIAQPWTGLSLVRLQSDRNAVPFLMCLIFSLYSPNSCPVWTHKSAQSFVCWQFVLVLWYHSLYLSVFCKGTRPSLSVSQNGESVNEVVYPVPDTSRNLCGLNCAARSEHLYCSPAFLRPTSPKESFRHRWLVDGAGSGLRFKLSLSIWHC